MDISIPHKLIENVSQQPHGSEWLRQLPALVSDIAQQWNLSLGAPFEEDLTGAWVAPCISTAGPAVLKIGYPHFEADYEIEGLNRIAGTCAVHVFNFDKKAHAILLERCVPGTSLRSASDGTQDAVITALLKELWQTPSSENIRPLGQMIEQWCTSARNQFEEISENKDIIFLGIEHLEQLAADIVDPVFLATDLHAGNVLAALRRPWLIIDPKPHIGDPCYDLTQHLLNVKPRLDLSLIESMSRAAGVDAERVLRWTFGRLCLDHENHALATRLSQLL